MSALWDIQNGLISSLQVSRCEIIARYVRWEISEKSDFGHTVFRENLEISPYCFDRNFSSTAPTNKSEPMFGKLL